MAGTSAGMTPRLWRLMGEANPVTGFPKLRLGVNVDHVATVRNARGGRHPDPVQAAEIAVMAGAHGTTAQLPENRLHITADHIPPPSARTGRPAYTVIATNPQPEANSTKVRPPSA